MNYETAYYLKKSHYDLQINVEKYLNLVNEFNAEYKIFIKKMDDYTNKYLPEKIKSLIMSKFYGSYTPLYYDRSYDLENTFEFKMSEETELQQEFGFEFIQGSHRASNEWIYENSFIEGWHGGSVKDGDYTKRYWRTPYRYYRYWGREATNSGINLEDYLRKRTDELYDEEEEKNVQFLNSLIKDVRNLKNIIIKQIDNIISYF